MRKLIPSLFLIAVTALAQTSSYPGSVDTDSTLFVAGDNVQSKLSTAMAIGDSVAVVVDPTGFAVNMIATICDTQSSGKCTAWEHMKVTGVSGNVLTVTRGFAGTSARAHAKSATISVLIDAAHQQVLADSVKKIETALGPNLATVLSAATSTVTAALPSVPAVLYDFTPQTPGGSLVSGNNSITMTPVPLGVNGTDGQHYLYISGGTGTAEACKITGGAGTAGSGSGAIIVNCANSHSGAWTVKSASGGIKEASIAIGNRGTVTLPNSGINIYGPLILPTAVSVAGQGFSKTGTSGGAGSILTCATAANPCLVVADGLGTATGQGMSEFSGFKLYGPGSGSGLSLGGDPSGVYTPSTWSGSYTRYRDISIENFNVGITLNYEANFVAFDHVVSAGLVYALYVPSTAVSMQPVVFTGGLYSVPSGFAIIQDYNGFMTTQLVFVDSQISGTIGGNQVAIACYGVHFEPNTQGDPLVNINNNQQNDLRIIGGLLSVHGGGAFGGSAPPYVINASGAGLHNVTVKDVTLQVDTGSTVPEVVNFTPTIGGRLVLENVNRLAAGTFTRLRVFTPANPAGHVVNQPEWALGQNVAAAATTTFPEANFPDSGVMSITGATVGGSGITAVAGLYAGQTGKIVCVNNQTFTAGASIASTVTLTGGTLHSYWFDGVHLFIQ